MTFDTMPKRSPSEEIFGFNPEELNHNMVRYSAIGFVVTSFLPLANGFFKAALEYANNMPFHRIRRDRIYAYML